jgi:polyhydroxyalkanoate synthesis repressor PhaR
MSNSATPITIKKYANRRLYNTASSAYVTLADLAKMVKTGEDFVVFDAKTNEDITRSVLAQIIFEQEGIEGQSLLPITFLRQIIRFYGDSVQALLPSYLEFSIDRFTGEQQKMREAATRAFGNGPFAATSFGTLEELTRKNLAAFTQALGLFSPFTGPTASGATGALAKPAAKDAAASADIDELRAQLTEMKRRLDDGRQRLNLHFCAFFVSSVALFTATETRKTRRPTQAAARLRADKARRGVSISAENFGRPMAWPWR